MATIKSIEEKAKAYDEALKEAVIAHKDEDRHLKATLERIFPELKESEDEKIREEIISNLKEMIEGITSEEIIPHSSKVLVGKMRKWVAWLEKQGENISLPKFIFDDVLALQCVMETTKKVQEDKELYEQLQSLHDRLHDAYWLEKQGEQKPAETVKWSQQEESCICQLESLVKEKWRQAEIVHNSEKIKKMSELMFFLKTLNPNKKPDYCHHEVDLSDCSEEYCEAYYDGWNNCNQQHSQLRAMQKTWSEEDEKIKESIITGLEMLKDGASDKSLIALYNKKIDWLKFLKERYTWRPSEEQMEALEHFVRSIGESGYASPYDNNTKLLYLLLEQLKKLRGKL